MKNFLTFLAVALYAAVGTCLRAQTLNSREEMAGSVTTSIRVLNDESFVFEPDSFFNDFVPGGDSTARRFANWRVLGAAVDDQDFSFSTSAACFEGEVTSSNPAADALSFAGLNAYIWIRNDKDPKEAREWLLARSDSRIFPAAGGSCYDGELILSSVTDLDPNDDPKWGRHYGVMAPGVSGPSGTIGMQTYTLVPEPSSAVIVGVAGFGFVLCRRRGAI